MAAVAPSHRPAPPQPLLSQTALGGTTPRAASPCPGMTCPGNTGGCSDSADARRPVGGAELPRDAARCLANRVACRRIDRPGAGRHHYSDRTDSAVRRIEDGRRNRALADQRLFLFECDTVLAHRLQL